MSKRHIQPDDRIGVKLTQAERSLLLEGLTLLPSVYEEAVKGTPAKEPVMLTLDDLDELGGYIAADANHTQDKKRGKKLDAIFQKIQNLLDTHTDEEPHRTISLDDARKSKTLTDNAVQVAEFAAMALMAAESMGIKTKPLEHFALSPAQREVLLAVPDSSKSIKTKLKKDNASFTVAEVASMTMSLAETSIDGTPRQQVAALLVVNHLTDRLQAGIPGFGDSKPRKTKEPTTKADSHTVYQFKITLLGSKPPIWRRIQVADCTLDKLHEHIQTAIGWTNSHLHQFEIKGKRYGDPELIVDGFDDSNCVDSTRTRISKFFSDFSGDTWNFCGIRSCVNGFKVALDPVIQMSPARLRAVETDAFIVKRRAVGGGESCFRLRLRLAVSRIISESANASDSQAP